MLLFLPILFECHTSGLLNTFECIRYVKFYLVCVFPCVSNSKESACNMGNLGSIPGLGRSPGEGNSYPLQYSGLENSMDRRAWRATVHGVTKRGSQRVRHNWAAFTFSKNEAGDKIKTPIPQSLCLWKKALVHSACQFPHLQKEDTAQLSKSWASDYRNYSKYKVLPRKQEPKM